MRGIGSRMSAGRARGVAGLAVLAVFALIVIGWWGDFRYATRDIADQGSQEGTPTPEAAAPGGDGADQPTGGDSDPQAGEKKVIVLVDGLNFRREPSRGAALIRGLAEGEELVHLSTAQGWHHVRDADGTVGYVSASDQYSKVQ